MAPLSLTLGDFQFGPIPATDEETAELVRWYTIRRAPADYDNVMDMLGLEK